MTRYLNFCRPEKPQGSEKHYQMYRDSYKAYEDGRKEYRKQYNEAYRELNDGKIECECGAVIAQLSIYAHKKSQKHINASVERGLP
jgi:hypothetical protein